MIDRNLTKKGSMPLPLKIEPLSIDEIDDAEFSARDEGWAAVAALFDERSERKEISFKSLADRIGRKKSQVHRWLRSSSNITLKSLGLLAAGMDARVDIRLIPIKDHDRFSNQCHPSISAAAMVDVELYSHSRVHTYSVSERLEDDFLSTRASTSVEVHENV